MQHEDEHRSNTKQPDATLRKWCRLCADATLSPPRLSLSRARVLQSTPPFPKTEHWVPPIPALQYGMRHGHTHDTHTHKHTHTQ